MDKLIFLFSTANKEKLLKSYLYTAIKKNADMGKKLFNNYNYSGSFISSLVDKGFLKNGFEKSARFRLTNRQQYMNSDSVKLISSVYNKRKFKSKGDTKKSGFHYGADKLKYADKFIYNKMGNPADSNQSKIQNDADKGIQMAIDDAMRKAGFSK